MRIHSSVLRSLLHLINADAVALTLWNSQNIPIREESIQKSSTPIETGILNISYLKELASLTNNLSFQPDPRKLFNRTHEFKNLSFLKVIPIFSHQELIGALTLYKNNPAAYWCDEFELFIRTILDPDKTLSYEHCLSGFLKSIEMKDHYTSGHSERVMFLTEIILNRLEHVDREAIIKASLLHDVGKLTLEISTLNCTKKLTPEQIFHLQQHPQMGHEILSPIQGFTNILPIVLYHHENFDGSGYPHALSANSIPLGSRIISVVDSFDAMTSDRVYRRSRSTAEAFKELIKFKGTQFDPTIVDIFIEGLTKSLEDKKNVPVFLQKEIHGL